MLGDVEVDWSLPPATASASTHRRDGATDDLLVCIPLPGRRRYRMSMLVPERPAPAPARPGRRDRARLRGGTGHRSCATSRPCWTGSPPSRRGPRNLRWSSVFRISHRIVDSLRARAGVRRRRRRAHPPADRRAGHEHRHPGRAQPGVEARAGRARRRGPGLLDSYDAERRPIGEEVVGRTVRHARAGFQSDDPATIMLREAQLLVSLSRQPHRRRGTTGPGSSRAALHRASAPGLPRPAARRVAFPLRLYEVLDGRRHTLLALRRPGRADRRARRRGNGRSRGRGNAATSTSGSSSPGVEIPDNVADVLPSRCPVPCSQYVAAGGTWFGWSCW